MSLKRVKKWLLYLRAELNYGGRRRIRMVVQYPLDDDMPSIPRSGKITIMIPRDRENSNWRGIAKMRRRKFSSEKRRKFLQERPNCFVLDAIS
jgi:hypothetical protein